MKPITDLTANNPSANAINTFWEPSRDDVFSEFRWPFATNIDLLDATTDTSPIWQVVYTYPTTAARVWTVFGALNTTQINPLDGSTQFVSNITNEEQQEFEVYYSSFLGQKVIGSNNIDAYCRQTYIIEDFSIWDAKFIMAFSYRLAANMTVLLTGDGDKALKMMSVYNAFMAETKRTAYSERTKKPSQISGYQTSRG